MHYSGQYNLLFIGYLECSSMKARERIISMTMMLLICFQVIFPTTSAHTGGIFTIIVSENFIFSCPNKIDGNSKSKISCFLILQNYKFLWSGVSFSINDCYQIFTCRNFRNIYVVFFVFRNIANTFFMRYITRLTYKYNFTFSF